MGEMGRLLLTGGNGFIGRNIINILGENVTVFAPTRKALDLKDGEAIKRYVADNAIDTIVHAANPNPVKNPVFDNASTMFEDSIRIFMNIYNVRNDVSRVLYLGSGAEYNKTLEIHKVCEDEARRSLPPDVYGCAKYVMNELASSTDNVINLRVFACYGPTDHESKFITHCIKSILSNRPITIRQDCVFDYLHVNDLGRVISYFVSHKPNHNDYNVASGKSIRLSEIARMVLDEMGASGEPVLLSEGLNHEYTADVTRLENETGLVHTFIPLREGIRQQIRCEECCL